MPSACHSHVAQNGLLGRAAFWRPIGVVSVASLAAAFALVYSRPISSNSLSVSFGGTSTTKSACDDEICDEHVSLLQSYRAAVTDQLVVAKASPVPSHVNRTRRGSPAVRVFGPSAPERATVAGVAIASRAREARESRHDLRDQSGSKRLGRAALDAAEPGLSTEIRDDKAAGTMVAPQAATSPERLPEQTRAALQTTIVAGSPTWADAAIGAILVSACGGTGVLSAIFMKSSMSFRNVKSTSGVLAAQTAKVLATWVALQFYPLSMAWAYITAAELVLVTLVGACMYEEHISSLSGAALFFLGGAIFLMDSKRHAHQAAATLASHSGTFFGNNDVCEIVALMMTSIAIAYAFARHVKLTLRWQVLTLKYVSLAVATLYEVAIPIFLRAGYFAVALCSAYSTASFGILMLEFMDLHAGWAIYTAAEFAIVEAYGIYLHGGVNPTTIVCLFVVFICSIVLSGGLRFPFDTQNHVAEMEQHLSLVRNRLHMMMATRQEKNAKVVVVIGNGGVGDHVLAKLCAGFDRRISQVVLVDSHQTKQVAKMSNNPPLFSWGNSHGLDSLQFPPIFVPCKFDNIDFGKVLIKMGLRPGDAVIDLSNCIPTTSLLRACNEHGFHMVSSRVFACSQIGNSLSMHEQVAQCQDIVAELAGSGPTAVVAHGMNPGLSTFCVKKAMLDLGHRLGIAASPINEDEYSDTPEEVPEDIPEKLQLLAIAEEADVTAVDITHVDTQESGSPVVTNEILSTTCLGFFDEIARREAVYHGHNGPVSTGQLAIDTQCTSVSFGEQLQTFQGHLVSHEEVHTIPKLFPKDRVPIVRLVHQPTPQQRACLASTRHITTESLMSARSLRRLDKDTLPGGYTSVGAYVKTRGGQGQWCGLKCNVADAWSAVDGGNAASWLSACGILVALQFCFEFPDRGACFPEDLPLSVVHDAIHDYVVSLPVDVDSKV